MSMGTKISMSLLEFCNGVAGYCYVTDRKRLWC